MDIHITQFLSLKQKVRLALSVYVIYWPIRQYMSQDHFGWDMVRSNWLIWLVELVVTVLYFIFWLSVTEWIERRFVDSFQTGNLIEYKLPAQLATLVIAGLLAVVFNAGYGSLWRKLNYVLNHDEMAMHMERLPKLDRQEGGHREGGGHHRQEKINNGLVVITLLSAFYLATNQRGYQQIQELRVNSEQLKREATQAQLVALKNQVNPHFLFNSLSILASLVEIDTRLSVQFITRLSKAFRYVLEQREMEQVSLATELEFLDAYTFLLNIRFDEKVKIVYTVSQEQANQYSIAPLTLQLLVENAVKHNQMSEEQPLTVSIYIEGDYLLITNPIQLRLTPQPSTGLGLQNIKNRYRLLADRPVETVEENGFFIVKIPLLS